MLENFSKVLFSLRNVVKFKSISVNLCMSAQIPVECIELFDRPFPKLLSDLSFQEVVSKYFCHDDQIFPPSRPTDIVFPRFFSRSPPFFFLVRNYRVRDWKRQAHVSKNTPAAAVKMKKE